MGRQKKKALYIGMPCFYCGELANCADHVTPHSYGGNNTEYVPVCNECNCLLGAKVFDSKEFKGEYIYYTLKRRFRHLKDQANRWPKEELETLGPTLRKYIEGQNALAETAMRRIDYSEQFTASAYMPAPPNPKELT